MTKVKLYVVAASTALSVSLSACGDSNADPSVNKGASAASLEVQVKVQELQLRPFVETLHLSGTIRAVDDITLAPEEGGVVKKWKYAKGAYVRKGEVIVQLNDDVIKPGYDAAVAQYKSSELTFEKQQKVFDEQAVSEWQLKTTEYGRDAARAQAELMQARWERTRIKSPVNGILDERYFDIGEMAPPGMPIARVVNITQVKIVINVPERYAGSIAIGTPISLSVLAHPGEAFKGKISFVGAAISADNRTFPVESVLPNPGQLLKPEMIANVNLSVSNRKKAILIDEGIVQQVDRNKLVVYVVREGVAQERIIQLGGRQDNLVEVVSGLESGEQLITSGYQEVINGQAVSVVK